MPFDVAQRLASRRRVVSRSRRLGRINPLEIQRKGAKPRSRKGKEVQPQQVQDSPDGDRPRDAFPSPFSLRLCCLASLRFLIAAWTRLGARGLVMVFGLALTCREEANAEEPAWRPLPLIVDGKVAEGWCQVGWGGFVVEDGALRTACDPRGLGFLVYEKERFGNCQIRVVFRAQEARSNAGAFVRIADGILDQVGKPGAAFDRGTSGRISTASMKAMMASAEREEGPWFAVHRGYEVQTQNHDPGDVVWFKEVSVRPLPDSSVK